LKASSSSFGMLSFLLQKKIEMFLKMTEKSIQNRSPLPNKIGFKFWKEPLAKQSTHEFLPRK
jgi:hypothetical protein